MQGGKIKEIPPYGDWGGWKTLPPLIGLWGLWILLRGGRIRLETLRLGIGRVAEKNEKNSFASFALEKQV